MAVRRKKTRPAVRKKRAGAKASARKPKANPRKTAVQRVRAFRLPSDVRPVNVDVAVEVDPGRGATYRGQVGIDLTLGRRRRSLELHAVGLRTSRARLRVGEIIHRGRVAPHTERGTVEILFDTSIPAGCVRLELTFSGRLRKDLCGLYSARVGEHRYAFTQLEAANARRFFPCFDDPAKKARFRLSVTTGAENAVISNSPADCIQTHVDGRKTVHFARTPLLSSYLLALAVGPLERSEGTFAGSTEIRVWHVPGKVGLAAFALEAARETLLRLESYFDLPYPYAKLDLVAVPDFEFGAMENAGAVFFRETLLLLNPESASLAEKKRAAEVICHELAHMWYGDLVTMAWWDDLWLNEAFATWMAFSIVDAWKPEWKLWQSFLHDRAAALDMDALRNTHPIYAKVRTPEEADANFDLITYEKGASVVRMIERFLGADIFRAGVRMYIRRHRESNAEAADLWKALSEASGQNVERMVRAWIEQEGYPVVRLRRTESDGVAALELRQERFFERPPKRRAGPSPRWPVPWVGRVGNGVEGRTHIVRHLLTRRRDRIPAPGADLTFVYGNADEGGFFRPWHDEGDRVDLVENLPSLNPLERQGFLDHQWALVRAGHIPMASLLDLTAALGSETDPEVLAAVRRPVSTLARRLAPDTGTEIEERLRAWISVYYGGQVDELGWRPAAGESDETRLRRAVILEIVGRIGRAGAVLDAAEEHCERYLADRSSLDPNLADGVVSMAAGRGDARRFDAFLEAMRRAKTPQDHQRFLFALADFELPELIDRALALSLTEEVATQDVVLLLARLLRNRSARESAWRFVQKRWARLRRRMPPLLASRLIEATPSLASRSYRREVAQFFKENPVPSGARPLRQALERFDWYAAYRRRAGPELSAYLSG